jgi:octaprenyl-diphosphate synthase
MLILQTAQSDAQLGEQIEIELADVENRFAAELISDLKCVNTLVTHIERYRGKMLRPTLVLVSGMATIDDPAAVGDPTRVIATVVELVHMATLVHDDVLDEARTRRRGRTVNDLAGNETAVMLGDYLISHAYHLCSSLDRPAINHLIADATNTVCEGELLQLANRNNWDLDEKTYFEIIRRKTASLCGTCCRVAAILSNAPAEVADGLYDYGEKLGVAYQIVDDVLDLTGSERTVGKTLGRDLQKGKATLPLIHTLRQGPAADRSKLRALLAKLEGSQDESQLLEVRELVGANGSVDHANKWAASLVEQAKLSVMTLAPTPCRQLLLNMADAVLGRRF